MKSRKAKQAMKELKFKKSYPLFLEGRLDQLPGNPDRFPAFIGELKARGILEVFIFGDARERGLINALVPALRANGCTVSVTDVESIRNNNNTVYQRQNEFVRSRLNMAPGLFLFSRQNAAEVLSYTAIYLLSIGLRGRLESPESIIQFLCERDELQEEDIRVFIYNKFRNPAYQIPGPVLEFAGMSPLPATPAAAQSPASDGVTTPTQQHHHDILDVTDFTDFDEHAHDERDNASIKGASIKSASSKEVSTTETSETESIQPGELVDIDELESQIESDTIPSAKATPLPAGAGQKPDEKSAADPTREKTTLPEKSAPVSDRLDPPVAKKRNPAARFASFLFTTVALGLLGLGIYLSLNRLLGPGEESASSGESTPPALQIGGLQLQLPEFLQGINPFFIYGGLIALGVFIIIPIFYLGLKRRKAEKSLKDETEKSIAVAQDSSEDNPNGDTAQEQGSPSISFEGGENFKASRFWTIRNKLLLIISGIILTALGIMIFFASSYFRNSSESQITSFNIRTTSLITKNVETKFRDLSKIALDKSSNLVGSLPNPRADEIFFLNNAQFVYLGVTPYKSSPAVFSREVYNTEFLLGSQVPRDKFRSVINAYDARFKQAQNTQVVVNVSREMGTPMLALALPLGEGANRLVAIAFFVPGEFIEIFQSQGDNTTYMVDKEGDLIIAGKNDTVLKGGNRGDSTIVKILIEKGSTRGAQKVEFVDKNGHPFLGFIQKLNFANLGVISTVDKENAFYEVTVLQRINLTIMMIVLFTAILLVFFFARTMSVPITKLVWATRKVEAGDYESTLEPSTRDEIGSLAHSFARMTAGLAEREKMKDAFGKFVNKEIADRAARGEIKLGGEKKLAAIFFSDLRGFTAMSEKMSPEEVVEYLNEYFTGMVRCVNETNGTVDKYIGDAIMAHWGALISKDNDTENAVNAALGMRESLFAFNERGGGNRPFAKFGCGINTGDVISGQIGSEERFEYTVIGDAVNLASRIETLNKPFGTDILISTDSYKLVQDIFNVEKMPAITVKGKTEPQIIYAVLGRKDDPACPKNMNEVRKRMGMDQPKVDLNNYKEESEEKFEVLEK